MPVPSAHELFQAIWRQEADTVRTILGVRPDLVVVMALIDLGADVNYVSSIARWRRPAGTSVLHAACYAVGTTTDVIEALTMKGANTKLKDSEGQLAIDVARAQSRDDLVAVLDA